MARLILEAGRFEPDSINLNWGITRVGRADDNDFIIRHPSISAHHAEIELGLDFIRVRDCDSTNGTFVENQRVDGVTSIAPGQHLRFGDIPALIEQSQETVAVPSIERPKPSQSVELAADVWSCERHNGTRARWRCPKCGGRFCGPCIHELRLQRGRPHRLCPVCSAHVEWIRYEDDVQRKKSVWTHVKDFLRGD